MKTELQKQRQVDVVLRESGNPFRLHGSCIIRIEPRPESRAVATDRGTFRVAFKASEIRVLAGAMARACPRVNFNLPVPSGVNFGYVPGRHGRPFLVAFRAADGLVKIGAEIADDRRHPVVELKTKNHSRVRWVGAEVTWQPSWTEFRILCGEFAAG